MDQVRFPDAGLASGVLEPGSATRRSRHRRRDLGGLAQDICCGKAAACFAMPGIDD